MKNLISTRLPEPAHLLRYFFCNLVVCILVLSILLLVGKVGIAQSGKFHLTQNNEGHWQIEYLKEHTFGIYIGNTYLKELPPMVGQFRQEPGKVIFLPSFGFRTGVDYTAISRQDTFRFSLPHILPKEFNKLADFYPSNDTLPANLLKVYLEFTAPMSEGMAYQHIVLLNEKGDTVYQPFLRLQPELWNQDQTRLTLWLDPGRVKRDLGPNQMHGAPLVPGQHFLFLLSKNWEDQNGNPLEEDFKKSFYVTKADRSIPKPKAWQLSIPKPNSRESLLIQFPESLDYALLKHTITILADDDHAIAGHCQSSNEEKGLIFTPSQYWKPGNYEIRIDSKLEDLAGNNLNRLFDRDLAKSDAQLQEEKPFYKLAFSIPEEKIKR